MTEKIFFPDKLNKKEKIEQNEKGKNVEIVLHILRHGDRDLNGNLQNYGRERTAQSAKKSNLNEENFDIIKAFGSTAGPKADVDGKKMQRSLETAHIFANEISSKKKLETRPRKILSYENIKSPLPYKHREVYDSFIGEYIKNNWEKDGKILEFNDLSEEQKKKAAEYADSKTVSHFMSLGTEEAKQMKKEIAGSFVIMIEQFTKMAKEKLNSNQKLLFPLGSHTGMMEPFLSEAMVWINEEGEEKIGATLEEMGGSFDPSEGFDVKIKTDKNGNLEEFSIIFENSNRPQGKIYLGMDKIKELSEFYKNIHKKRN